MRSFRVLLKKSGFRYLFIGGSVYVFELAVIVIAQAWGASAVWAVAISFCAGSLVSFLLQKLITFRDRRMHHRVLLPQLLVTILLLVWNLAFSVVLTKLLQRHIPAVITRTIALGITTVWNFYLYKTRIFKVSEEKVIG